MDDYQRGLFELFKSFRLEPKYPAYPPYHEGEYLEDALHRFFQEFTVRGNNIDRYYIPVSWTTVYNDNLDIAELRALIKGLDDGKKYFTVCQRALGIGINLPADCLLFSAGRNHGIPIPLVSSKIPVLGPDPVRDIYCSFVGSDTHPIRKRLAKTFGSKKDYHIEILKTSDVNPSKVPNYIDVMRRSKFSFCPRGFGPTSFRLYEALQLGSIPVYISDDHVLPWGDVINWNNLCVIVKSDDIHSISDRLSAITDERREEMLLYARAMYQDFFTIPAVCRNIIKRLLPCPLPPSFSLVL